MDLNIVNCKGCGRMFKRVGQGRLCPECSKALEEKFDEVRKYISEHRGASIAEVSREVEVSIDQIKTWIREDRLQLDEAADPEFCCLSCGIPIRSGKYCNTCKSKVISNLSSAYPTHKEPAEGSSHSSVKDRMRYL